MAQNTERIEFGRFTFKFSEIHSAFTWDEQERLVRSIGLATAALSRAIEKLSAVRTALMRDPAGPAGVAGDILFYHFRLPEDDRTGWRGYLTTLLGNLRGIHTGLSGPLTIADSYATIMGKALRDHVDLEVEELITGLPRAQAFAGWYGASPANRAAVLGAHAQAMSKLGFVAAPKDAVPAPKLEERHPARIAPRPMVVPAEMKGSIHINFQELSPQAGAPLASIAELIIHEASHKFCDTVDIAYGDETAKYAGMTQAQAMRNADSYALAAMSLYYGCLLLSRDTMRLAATAKHIDLNA